MKILHIDSIITGPGSISRRLSKALVDRLGASADAVTVVRRDLASDPLPYFGPAIVTKSAHVHESALAAEVLREFMEGDVIVIAVSMYNYGIPAQLKTWIDYLAVPGVTFRYTERGSEGLAGARKVYLASSRGGLYESCTAAAAREHQDSYLVSVLSFFGIEAVEIVRAQGVKVSRPHADRAVAEAMEHIATIIPHASPRESSRHVIDAL